MWSWKYVFANWSDAAPFSTLTTVSPSLLGRPHTSTRLCSQKIICILHRQCFLHSTLHTRFFFARVLVVQTCARLFSPHVLKSVQTSNFPSYSLFFAHKLLVKNYAHQGPNGMCKKHFWMQKIAGHIARAIRIPEGRTVRHQYRVLWTDAMQTLDSYMRGLGFFCNVCSKNRWGWRASPGWKRFLEPQLIEAILQIYPNQVIQAPTFFIRDRRRSLNLWKGR